MSLINNSHLKHIFINIIVIVIVIFYYECNISYDRVKCVCSNRDQYEFLLELSNKFNDFSRFKHEFQNFVLSVISRKTSEDIISLTNKEIDIIKDLIKYKFIKSLRKILCNKNCIF